MIKKELYMAPVTAELELSYEGIICLSGDENEEPTETEVPNMESGWSLDFND